jgi:energy-coupling factor transport system ATP-binding protein
MKNIITIDNLCFKYGDNQLFNNFNLNIIDGEWLSIVGPSGSGKSTLAKILIGILDFKGNIVVDKLILDKQNIIDIRKMIAIVFDNPDNQFIGETVKDDLAFALENLNYTADDINSKIMEIAKKLSIEELLEKKPQQLSGGQKQKVALASSLIYDPKIIILDEALSMVDLEYKKEILDLLKQLNKEENKTIIYISHDLEETLHSDRIVALNRGNKVVEGNTFDVFKQEVILSRLGLELPFMIDLSLKLKFYNLIDDIELDMNEMVVKLWK